MSSQLTIALDAMGGDRAPDIVVDGADIARERYSGIKFLFFGQEAKLKPLLSRRKELSQISEIVHTQDIITSEEKPSQALRTGRKSSMWLAIEAVRDELAGGVVSAGNTGALMAISRIVLGMIPGIIRPAIASVIPTRTGQAVMLDLGANAECSVEHLVQFAVMGDAFARSALHMLEPKIGLVNIGTEDNKGTEEIRQAHVMLKKMAEAESKFSLNYHGFIEGYDVPLGTVDVAVADGFSGNVCLKTIEGTARLYAGMMRQAIKHSFFGKIGYLLALPAFNKLKERVDPRRYNGALFLGVNGSVVKSHGGADAYSFSCAISAACDMIQNGFVERVRAEIEEMSHAIMATKVPPEEE